MGNCSFKSVAISDAKESNTIRIMTDCGDIVEFEGPKFTGKVLGNFPGYSIFRKGRIASPLLDNEELCSGQIYFLLPLGKSNLAKNNELSDPISEPSVRNSSHACENIVCDSTQNMVDSRNLNKECSSEAEPTRMPDNLLPVCKHAASESTQKSKDTEAEPMRMSTSAEVLPSPQKGVWKVKFVINTKQLEEILSEEVNTEALIQQMRLAASTGTTTPRQTKINWGQWGANWKPMRSAVFNRSVDKQSKIRSPKSDTRGLIERKTEMSNEPIAAI